MADLDHLPGAELVVPGLRDLARGELTAEALLVAAASTALARCGVAVPTHVVDEPELRLYALLASVHGDDAHARYNALRRRVDSLIRALEAEEGRRIRAAR